MPFLIKLLSFFSIKMMDFVEIVGLKSNANRSKCSLHLDGFCGLQVKENDILILDPVIVTIGKKFLF